MRGAAFLAIALFLLATMPVLVRCETTFVNEQFALNSENRERDYYVDLTKGDTAGITLQVSGLIDFTIYYSTNPGWNKIGYYDNIGTDGFQGHWDVTQDGTYDFEVYLASGDQANVTITLTSAGTGSQPPSNIKASGGVGAGGSDPLPTVVVVMVLLAVLISALFIVRLRKQPPPPPPTEGQPPPPP